MAAANLPAGITAGTKTVGVRLPDDDKVRALVRSCGGALTATSANPSGGSPARTTAEVERDFGAQIDMVIDGGEAETDQPSTVIDATTEEVKLVRAGVLPWPSIRQFLVPLPLGEVRRGR